MVSSERRLGHAPEEEVERFPLSAGVQCGNRLVDSRCGYPVLDTQELMAFSVFTAGLGDLYYTAGGQQTVWAEQAV